MKLWRKNLSKNSNSLSITLFFFSCLSFVGVNIFIGGSILDTSVPFVSTLPCSNDLWIKLYVSSLFKPSSKIILSSSSFILKIESSGSMTKEGKVLIIKTDVRGQLAQIEYKSIETIVIDDVTSFKVKYKTMSISNNEEWEFEILN